MARTLLQVRGLIITVVIASLPTVSASCYDRFGVRKPGCFDTGRILGVAAGILIMMSIALILCKVARRNRMRRQFEYPSNLQSPNVPPSYGPNGASHPQHGHTGSGYGYSGTYDPNFVEPRYHGIGPPVGYPDYGPPISPSAPPFPEPLPSHPAHPTSPPAQNAPAPPFKPHETEPNGPNTTIPQYPPPSYAA